MAIRSAHFATDFAVTPADFSSPPDSRQLNREIADGGAFRSASNMTSKPCALEPSAS